VETQEPPLETRDALAAVDEEMVALEAKRAELARRLQDEEEADAEEREAKEREARCFWPEDKPLPATYVPGRAFTYPCSGCRRVLLDDLGRAAVRQYVNDKIAALRCRACGHRWELPVEEGEPIKSPAPARRGEAGETPAVPGKEEEEPAEPSRVVDVALPVGEAEDDAAERRHVEVMLDRHQATAMSQVLDGLRSDGAELSNGRPVQSVADVVRYVAEGVGDRV